MRAEIIAIGDELTSGRILNTTSNYAAHRLFQAGHEIHAMHTIGDTPELIGEILVRAIGRVDLILVTGGLGATDDDLTNEAVSQALNRPASLYPTILSQIREHSEHDTCESLEKLAWLPRGAELLSHDSRMAGHLLIHDQVPIFFLPGVPSQMHYMMDKHVLPWLAAHSPGLHSFQCLYKFFKASEIAINEDILKMQLDPEVEIGYYPVNNDIHLSLTVRDHDHQHSKKLFDHSCARIKRHFGQKIYGQDQDTLASVIGQLLAQNNLTLALAESCTGGLISSKITAVPGSSDYFLGGVTSYADSMKLGCLGVDNELLSKYGAVSSQIAGAMAENIKQMSGAGLTLSVTGIAGPGGGSAEKPVGTVHMGMSGPAGLSLHHFLFSGDRQNIQAITSQTALDLLRCHLLELMAE